MPSVEIIPAGLQDISAYATGDGNTLLFNEGDQQLTAGGAHAARTLEAVQIAKTCRVSNTPGDPLVLDINTHVIGTTTPSTFIDQCPDAQPFYAYPGGPAGIWARLKLLGNRRFYLQGGGWVKQIDGRSGTCNVAANVRLSAVNAIGSAFDIKANSNLLTDVLVKRSAFSSERGFSGIAQICNGAVADFRLKTTPAGSLPAGNVMKVTGGSTSWMLGDIAELWLLDGAFDISQVPKACAIAKLYITSDMLRSKDVKLVGQNAVVTLPSTVGTDLFVIGDESDLIAR